MIEGVVYISYLLPLCSYREEVYLGNMTHPHFTKSFEDLYTSIFDYQIRLICHLRKKPIKRGALNAIASNKWTALLDVIKSLDNKCNSYYKFSREEDERLFRAKELKYQKQIYDVFKND